MFKVDSRKRKWHQKLYCKNALAMRVYQRLSEENQLTTGKPLAGWTMFSVSCFLLTDSEQYRNKTDMNPREQLGI